MRRLAKGSRGIRNSVLLVTIPLPVKTKTTRSEGFFRVYRLKKEKTERKGKKNPPVRKSGGGQKENLQTLFVCSWDPFHLGLSNAPPLSLFSFCHSRKSDDDRDDAGGRTLFSSSYPRTILFWRREREKGSPYSLLDRAFSWSLCWYGGEWQ